MRIDDQLLDDCHVLGTLEHATVLLNRNAAVGWMILVVDTEAVDWHELEDEEHQRVTRQVRALTGLAAEWFDADKMNVASLGNQVAQLHVHVVARQRGDACWPKPVWGHLDVQRAHPPAAIESLRNALVERLGLAPTAAAR